MRKTKIISTLGPGSGNPETIRALIESGADVFRLNFSHGTYEYFERLIPMIRRQAEEAKKSIAILADLQGPKIRTGKLKNGCPVKLKNGQAINVTNNDVLGDDELFTINCKTLLTDFTVGDSILINDGQMSLTIKDVKKDHLVTEVVRGGELSEHKGVNFPDTKMSLPSLTEKDKKDLAFALKHGVDLIALSFVRSVKDIRQIKAEIGDLGYEAPVIAKIEKPHAVEEIDGILEEADGIMVARGDLGVELPYEQVPIVQKRLICLANRKRKIVITATQMLESMIQQPTPTRAEVSDVANAVFDGTDALMLSGETAVGKYPLESIKKMASIALTAEGSEFSLYNTQNFDHSDHSDTLAIAHAAVDAAVEGKLKAIVVSTLTGKTAMIISKRKPPVPIIALTPNPTTFTKMNLFWGVIPVLTDYYSGVNQMIGHATELIMQKNIVQKGDKVALVAGIFGVAGSSNLLKIHKIQ